MNMNIFKFKKCVFYLVNTESYLSLKMIFSSSDQIFLNFLSLSNCSTSRINPAKYKHNILQKVFLIDLGYLCIDNLTGF